MNEQKRANIWFDPFDPVDMLRARTKMRVSQVRTLVLTGLKNDRANLSRQPSFCHFSRTDPLTVTPSLFLWKMRDKYRLVFWHWDWIWERPVRWQRVPLKVLGQGQNKHRVAGNSEQLQ